MITDRKAPMSSKVYHGRGPTLNLGHWRRHVYHTLLIL